MLITDVAILNITNPFHPLALGSSPMPRRPEGLHVLPQAGAQLRPLGRLGLHRRRPERPVRLAQLRVRAGAQRAPDARVRTQGQQEHLPRGRPHVAEVIMQAHTNTHTRTDVKLATIDSHLISCDVTTFLFFHFILHSFKISQFLII